jgi:hypothetical protein
MSATTTQPAEAPAGQALYGLMAEFETPEAAVTAARRVHAEGYRALDAYSPFPVDELSDAIGFKKNRVATCVLLGGLAGGIGGFMMQYFSAVIHYPLNIGGRPYFSWPVFLPVTFELTVLIAAFSAVISMLVLNGLPQPHHPVFNCERFTRASNDRFFLVVEATDPKFDRQATRRLLEGLNPTDVSEVES